MRFIKQLAKRRFATHLSVAFVILVVITTLAVGLPSYWIISTELETQAWARIEDAEHIVRVSMDAEQSQLDTVALLAAQRPSLKYLVQSHDVAALTDYVQTFQANQLLDTMAVYDPSGNLLASRELPPGLEPYPLTTANLMGDDSGLVLVASQPIPDDVSDEPLGYVLVGIRLDDQFFKQLATETGFEQSIVVNGVRVATSLDHASTEIKNWPALERELQSAPSWQSKQSIGGDAYYSVVIPFQDALNQSIVVLEVVMPIDSLITAQQRALFALALSSIAIALLGSLVGSFYAQRLASPLRQLTVAARQIGQGDLLATMPLSAKVIEVATLAQVLDESRSTIHHTLRELSQAKQWSETLIQSIVEGVVTVDAGGRITFLSRGAEQITGWDNQQAQGETISTMLKLPEHETVQLSAAPGQKREIQITTHDNQRKTLEVTTAELTPPKSETVQLVLVLRDITDQEIGRRMHSYFLGNITHEFRTPISGLKASIELLLEEADYLSPSELHELLNSTLLSVSGLQALVDNLLESVNIEGGRFSIQRRTTDLNQVMANSIAMVQPLLDRRRQRLSLVEPLWVPPFRADATRLTQVMINLLANASKYSPLETSIDICIEHDDTQVHVSVSDRGKGIPVEERAHLFNRFMRLSGSTTDQYGIGLGLSVVKAIIEGHGGDVGVDGRSGGGSTFWFTLPLVLGVHA